MLQPLKNKVLVQREETKTVTDSGFIIPEDAQKKETDGRIIALGSEADDVLKVGQRVLFGRLDGYDVNPKFCDGLERCILIKDDQVRLIYNA